MAQVDDKRRRRVGSLSEPEYSEGELDPNDSLLNQTNQSTDSAVENSSEYETTTDNEDDSDEYEDTDSGESVAGEKVEERQRGDGQEHSDANPEKLDDDEDRQNPAFVPRKGAFYEHDCREMAETAAEEKEDERGNSLKKVLWQESSKWNHDRFNLMHQQPKSRQELIAIYGYDIRAYDKPPDAQALTSKPRNRRKERQYLGDFIDDGRRNDDMPNRRKTAPRTNRSDRMSYTKLRKSNQARQIDADRYYENNQPHRERDNYKEQTQPKTERSRFDEQDSRKIPPHPPPQHRQSTNDRHFTHSQPTRSDVKEANFTRGYPLNIRESPESQMPAKFKNSAGPDRNSRVNDATSAQRQYSNESTNVKDSYYETQNSSSSRAAHLASYERDSDDYPQRNRTSGSKPNSRVGSQHPDIVKSRKQFIEQDYVGEYENRNAVSTDYNQNKGSNSKSNLNKKPHGERVVGPGGDNQDLNAPVPQMTRAPKDSPPNREQNRPKRYSSQRQRPLAEPLQSDQFKSEFQQNAKVHPSQGKHYKNQVQTSPPKAQYKKYQSTQPHHEVPPRHQRLNQSAAQHDHPPLHPAASYHPTDVPASAHSAIMSPPHNNYVSRPAQMQQVVYPVPGAGPVASPPAVFNPPPQQPPPALGRQGQLAPQQIPPQQMFMVAPVPVGYEVPHYPLSHASQLAPAGQLRPPATQLPPPTAGQLAPNTPQLASNPVPAAPVQVPKQYSTGAAAASSTKNAAVSSSSSHLEANPPGIQVMGGTTYFGPDTRVSSAGTPTVDNSTQFYSTDGVSPPKGTTFFYPDNLSKKPTEAVIGASEGVHVRGGTMYFPPPATQPLPPAPRSPTRRTKSAIPIVNPTTDVSNEEESEDVHDDDVVTYKMSQLRVDAEPFLDQQSLAQSSSGADIVLDEEYCQDEHSEVSHSASNIGTLKTGVRADFSAESRSQKDEVTSEIIISEPQEAVSSEIKMSQEEVSNETNVSMPVEASSEINVNKSQEEASSEINVKMSQKEVSNETNVSMPEEASSEIIVNVPQEKASSEIDVSVLQEKASCEINVSLTQEEMSNQTKVNESQEKVSNKIDVNEQNIDSNEINLTKGQEENACEISDDKVQDKISDGLALSQDKVDHSTENNLSADLADDNSITSDKTGSLQSPHLPAVESTDNSTTAVDSAPPV